MVSVALAGVAEFRDSEEPVHHKYVDSQIDGGSTGFQLRKPHQVHQEQPPQSLDCDVLSIVEAVHDKDGKALLRVISIPRSTHS